MTQAEAGDSWEAEADELAHDDGAAVRAHLAAGRPVAYLEEDTPAGHVVLRYPDGRRELVRVDRDGDTVVAVLPSA